jgi:hypothetical protein
VSAGRVIDDGRILETIFRIQNFSEFVTYEEATGLCGLGIGKSDPGSVVA